MSARRRTKWQGQLTKTRQKNPGKIDPFRRANQCAWRAGGAGLVGWRLSAYRDPEACGVAVVDQVTPIAEATQAQGRYVHHRLKPLELAAGQLNVLAVRADGQIDPVRVAPGAPNQPGKVRQARAAPRRLPVDGDRPLQFTAQNLPFITKSTLAADKRSNC